MRCCVLCDRFVILVPVFAACVGVIVWYSGIFLGAYCINIAFVRVSFYRKDVNFYMQIY